MWFANVAHYCYNYDIIRMCLGGGMADAVVSKTIGLITRVGSTPTPGIFFFAHVAQSVEHILGKNEVNSSILFMGF